MYLDQLESVVCQLMLKFLEPANLRSHVSQLGNVILFIIIVIFTSLFLCMVLESVLVSFFYKWLTRFPSKNKLKKD